MSSNEMHLGLENGYIAEHARTWIVKKCTLIGIDQILRLQVQVDSLKT
jgi:hypothetical protein